MGVSMCPYFLVVGPFAIMLFAKMIRLGCLVLRTQCTRVTAPLVRVRWQGPFRLRRMLANRVTPNPFLLPNLRVGSRVRVEYYKVMVYTSAATPPTSRPGRLA